MRFTEHSIGLAVSGGERTAALLYNKAVGPTFAELSLAVVEGLGINCQLFLHWVLEELCCLSLPKEFLSSHIWGDQHFLESVDLTKELFQIGDIAFFCFEPSASPNDFHLAVMVGRDEKGAATFLHCLQFKDKTVHPVERWTLEDFATCNRNKYFFGVRRLKRQIPEIPTEEYFELILKAAEQEKKIEQSIAYAQVLEFVTYFGQPPQLEVLTF